MNPPLSSYSTQQKHIFGLKQSTKSVERDKLDQ